MNVDNGAVQQQNITSYKSLMKFIKTEAFFIIFVFSRFAVECLVFLRLEKN